MVMFHSYVSLPEGKTKDLLELVEQNNLAAKQRRYLRVILHHFTMVSGEEISREPIH